MQEEVEQKSLTLTVNAAKMTARLFRAAIAKYVAHRKEKKHDAQTGVRYVGRQSVKKLVGQNQGVSNVELSGEDIRLKKEWLFSIRRSRCFNPSSSLSARFCLSGAVLTCWKVTAGTTPARMLMYGKEASNRKQEIDRQHHTIPNQRKQRPKDKHCGNVHNRLWNHG